MKNHRIVRPASFFSLLAIALLAYACDGGTEGARCNPLLSHDDCDDGLMCIQPATCAESYCCPSDPTKSASPFCNGSECPSVDAGATSGDASAE